MTRSVYPGGASRALWVFFLNLCFGICLHGATADSQRSTIRIPYVPQAPVLEDFLGQAPPDAQVQIGDFRQRQPKDGEPASLATSAFLSHNGKNLYIVFVCQDDPAQVRAHMSRRESISNDDTVGVSLDTFHDGRRAYMFFANPLGVQLDGITTEGQPDDYTFDTVWRSEGRLTAGGYAVRFSIPFRSLRFAKDQRTWGIALTRHIPRNNEYSSWPYITDRVEAYVPQFAALEGLDGAPSGRNIQLIPYGFFSNRRFLDSGPRFKSRDEPRGGLDAKVVLRDTLTLDVALNPDFSQVESDEPQVTVNQRYEVFFPEKRPFFLDNAGFFQTPETVFFSRRILDPRFGARLTGKIGRWAIGALAMDDQAAGLEPGESGAARIGVARLQREIAGESSAGVMIASREFGATSNQVLSADTRIKLNPNWVVTGQAMRSLTRDPASLELAGSAYFGELRHVGRHFLNDTYYRDRSPGFRADVGFIPRVDIRQVRNSTGYRWRPESGQLQSFGPSIITLANWDHQGRLQDWSVETPFVFNFRGPSSLIVSRFEGYELYRNRGFRKFNDSVYFSSNRLKWTGVAAFFAQGRAINYYPASGLAPFAATSTEASLEWTVRPFSRARFDETYYYTRLGSSGAAVFTNHLVRSRLNYQFTRALSLRAIADYNAVLPNASLAGQERSKRIRTDLLLTYLVHPGTALYAGYSNQYENFTFTDGILPELRRVSRPGLSTGRQLFVKVSYLLHL